MSHLAPPCRKSPSDAPVGVLLYGRLAAYQRAGAVGVLLFDRLATNPPISRESPGCAGLSQFFKAFIVTYHFPVKGY